MFNLGYYCGPGERARTLSVGLPSATRLTENLYPLLSFEFVSNRVGYLTFDYACGFSLATLHKLGLAPMPKDAFFIALEKAIK